MYYSALNKVSITVCYSHFIDGTHTAQVFRHFTRECLGRRPPGAAQRGGRVSVWRGSDNQGSALTRRTSRRRRTARRAANRCAPRRRRRRRVGRRSASSAPRCLQLECVAVATASSTPTPRPRRDRSSRSHRRGLPSLGSALAARVSASLACRRASARGREREEDGEEELAAPERRSRRTARRRCGRCTTSTSRG